MTDDKIIKRYIDDFFEKSEDSTLPYDFETLKNEILSLHKAGKDAKEIVEYLQEKLYIYDDKEETDWEIKVVNSLIQGKPVINRWTRIVFK